MKGIITLLMVSVINGICFSQVDLEFEKKMSLKEDQKEYSWAHKNLFVDFKGSIFSEYLFIPPIDYIFTKTSGSYNDFEYYTDQGMMFSILTATLEPRINLVNFKKSSLTVKVPASIGLSIRTEGAEYDNKKTTGVFHITAPIMLGYARNLNSTFNNVNKEGFAINAGIQFMKISLAGNKFHEYYEEYYVSDIPFDFRNNWITPIVQLDYYRLNRKDKLRMYSLAFNPVSPLYFKFSAGFTLTKK